LNKESKVLFRGYFPLIPGGHSYKEAFETGNFDQSNNNSGEQSEDVHPLDSSKLSPSGRPYMRNILQENNRWPTSGNQTNDEQFKNIMLRYKNIYHNTLKIIFQLCLKGLGINPTKYADWFKNDLSTFRFIHYPSRLSDFINLPKEAKDGNVAITTGEHFDSSIITLLATFHFNGLQIKPVGYQHWLDVPSKRNHFVVNIGALLSHLLNNELISTNHRVIDIGDDRFSVAMFFEPHFDTDLSTTFYGGKNTLVGNYTKYGPWMTNRTSQFVEYKSTDFGIAD